MGHGVGPYWINNLTNIFIQTIFKRLVCDRLHHHFCSSIWIHINLNQLCKLFDINCCIIISLLCVCMYCFHKKSKGQVKYTKHFFLFNDFHLLLNVVYNWQSIYVGWFFKTTSNTKCTANHQEGCLLLLLF